MLEKEFKIDHFYMPSQITSLGELFAVEAKKAYPR